MDNDTDPPDLVVGCDSCGPVTGRFKTSSLLSKLRSKEEAYLHGQYNLTRTLGWTG